jgi:hypothetical protein
MPLELDSVLRSMKPARNAVGVIAGLGVHRLSIRLEAAAKGIGCSST